MTNSENSPKARPGPGKDRSKPTNDFTTNKIDFVEWLEKNLKNLEEKFESFKTVNSIRHHLGR